MGQRASRTDQTASAPVPAALERSEENDSDTEDLFFADRTERGAMEAALAELTRALDAEDLSAAKAVSDHALSKWPRWRALRVSRDRVAGYLAACASATSARRRPPPPDIESLRVTDVDEASLPRARAERTTEHLSRMADVLPRVFGCLAREPDPQPPWMSTPLLDKIIESSLRDTNDDESLKFGPRVEFTGPEKCREQLVLYQSVRSVSTSFCLPLYRNIRQFTIDMAWCAHIPPGAGDQFPNLESVTINGGYGLRTEAQFVQDTWFELPMVLRHLPKLRLLELTRIQIQEFPDWFAELPLKELYIELPTPVGYPQNISFEDETLLLPAWTDDESCLPRSLELLVFGDYICNLGLECVRRLPNLQELRMNNCSQPGCPEWLREITTLRRIQAQYLPLAYSVDALRECNLEAIEFSMEPYCGPMASENFLPALERLVVGTPCGASLRELNLRSNLLGSVPDCLRGLQLRVLHMAETGITALPSWISELPLISLDLEKNTRLATLPSSLHSLTTLRVLDVRGTNLGGPHLDFVYGSDEDEKLYPVLWIGGWMMEGGGPQNIADCVEEAVRRDSVLGPLSRALPELRLRIHEEPSEMCDSGNMEKNWWHERCGYDWLDPIFYTCEGARLDYTDGLEAARSAIRAARANASSWAV